MFQVSVDRLALLRFDPVRVVCDLRPLIFAHQSLADKTFVRNSLAPSRDDFLGTADLFLHKFLIQFASVTGKEFAEFILPSDQFSEASPISLHGQCILRMQPDGGPKTVARKQ